MTRYGADMEGVSTSERTRRVRAAWAYSGLTQSDLAERTGIAEGTIRGWLNKKRTGGPDASDASLIAKACGVPAAFMELGFAPLAGPVDNAVEEVYRLREEHGQRLALLEQAVTSLKERPA